MDLKNAKEVSGLLSVLKEHHVSAFEGLGVKVQFDAMAFVSEAQPLPPGAEETFEEKQKKAADQEKRDLLYSAGGP